MSLNSSQLAALKTNILANTNQVSFNGVSTPINELPIGNADAHVVIADWYNQLRSPDYYAWKSTVTRSEVYHSSPAGGSTWSWSTYKAQSVAEQNAWTQMFMGDAAPIGLTNFRSGVAAIFTGTAPQTAQRDHIFAVGRRLVRRIEHLFVTAITSPPANTGNDGIAGNRGNASNPDNLGYDGTCSPTDVEQALALP